MPNIGEILDQLGAAKYFSVFDLAEGFYQILMKKEDSHKTAFYSPYGHYEYKQILFDLQNILATFQKLMDNVLTNPQGNKLFVYLYDIVVYSKFLKEHEGKIDQLMTRLRETNL